MNEVRLFTREELEKKSLGEGKISEYAGVVYAIEYGDGFVKIGCSKIPSDRVFAVKHLITDYMQKEVKRVLISPWHTNYRNNELLVHCFFKDKRIENTELFKTSIESVLQVMESGQLEYLDETERFERESIEFCENMKMLMFNIPKYKKATEEEIKSIPESASCKEENPVKRAVLWLFEYEEKLKLEMKSNLLKKQIEVIENLKNNGYL